MPLANTCTLPVTWFCLPARSLVSIFWDGPSDRLNNGARECYLACPKGLPEVIKDLEGAEMSPCIRVGPKYTQKHSQRRRQREEGDREWCEVATSQDMPGVT